MSDVSLDELSILRNRVSQAQKLYYASPLGHPYEAYEMLKNSRREYAEMAVKFVEGMLDKNQLDNYEENKLDSECKECENVSKESRECDFKINEFGWEQW